MIMEFVKVDKCEFRDITKERNLIVMNREGSVVQADTDSTYICFQELKEKWFNDMDGFEFFDCLESLVNVFWDKILEIRAKNRNVRQLIIFKRENMFSHFFSFAKKLYIGAVVDSEGMRYSFEEPYRKIMGISITKDEMPEFCKKAASELVFKIAYGLEKKEAEDEILKIYEEFKKKPIDEISSKRTISDYKKYIPFDMSYYIERGFGFQKGWPANIKMAFSYNFLCAKEKIILEPIDRGEKFNYVFVNPTNKLRIECIAYKDNWPKDFNKYFDIDYETCYRKFLLPIFESMFTVLKWSKKKDEIHLEKIKMNNKFIVPQEMRNL